MNSSSASHNNKNNPFIDEVCARFDHDAARMMDILWTIQDQLGWISPETMQRIAERTGTYRVEVEGVVSFYAFFMQVPQGRFVIHLCDDIVDRHAGMEDVLAAFEQELGIQPGQTTSDNLFSLHLTPCIGMSDQAPAALVNHQVVPSLTPAGVKRLLRSLRKTGSLPALKPGDGNNQHPLIQSAVRNNILRRDHILLSEVNADQGLLKALRCSPQEVLGQIAASGLRGRGGAGFDTARKWQFAASTPTEQRHSRYVICNADEGEPGTFKDRVLLTERAHLLIEGMTIAAYAIGSAYGILYLRAEYRYLKSWLESVLQTRREAGLLGDDLLIDESDESEDERERARFSFDIRIQLGAGAYICGEESSLISSCEGKRGEPRNKPPFPAQSGYKNAPTIVNNVETFCNVARILDQGAAWFAAIGTAHSSGTKLLSVSGDCSRPGVYEFPMGVSIREVLTLCGAQDAEAVQVGGASGVMVGRNEFDRRLCFEDLPTAGALIVFNSTRNVLRVVDYYMQFFIDESCGYCTPCRVGNVFMKKALEKIMDGQGEAADLDYLKSLGDTIIATSRCGLGHTSPNPILSTMKNFPLVYSALLKERHDGLQAGFNIHKALNESRAIAKRRSIIYDPILGQKE